MANYNSVHSGTTIDNAITDHVAVSLGASWDFGSDDLITDGDIAFSGSVSLAVVTKTTAYTTTISDYMVLGNHASTAFTITLHAASTAYDGTIGQVMQIKNIGAAIVTVDGNASETIDGNLTITLNQYDSITIVSDGSNWHIL